MQKLPVATNEEISLFLTLGDDVEDIKERTKQMKLETDSIYVTRIIELLSEIPHLLYLIEDHCLQTKIKRSAFALDLLQGDLSYQKNKQINIINFISDCLLYGLKSMWSKEGVRKLLEKHDGFYIHLLLPYLNHAKPFNAMEELAITLKSPALYLIVLRVLSCSLSDFLLSRPQWTEKEKNIEIVGKWVELLKSLLKNLQKSTRESLQNPINNLLDKLGSSLVSCMSLESSQLEEILNIFIPVVIDIIQIIRPEGENKTENSNISSCLYSVAPLLTHSLQNFTSQSISILHYIKTRPKSTLSALRIFQLLRVLSKFDSFQQPLSTINIMVEALSWVKSRKTSHILHHEIKELFRNMVESDFYKENLNCSSFPKKISQLITSTFTKKRNKPKATEHIVYCAEMVRIYNEANPNAIPLSCDFLDALKSEHTVDTQKLKPTPTESSVSPPWSVNYNANNSSSFSPPNESSIEANNTIIIPYFQQDDFQWANRQTPVLLTCATK